MIVHSMVSFMCSMYLLKGILGCIGGLLLHLLVGSVYQWGIINVYVTSYYSLVQGPQSLTTNAVVFPVMMMSIGLTMKFGNFIAAKIGTPYMTLILSVIMPGLVFASSYSKIFAGFVMLYGVVFGLFGGMIFTSVLVQNNKYFVDKQAAVNGFILIGTGIGSAVFGIFSYNFLNPMKLSPINGLYTQGNLSSISLKVPECIRYLSLFYICLGMIGSLLIFPVYFHNQSKNNQNDGHATTTSAVQLKQISNQTLQSNPVGFEHIEGQHLDKMNIPSSVNQHQNAVVLKNDPQPPVEIFQCPDLKTAFSHRITYFIGIVFFLTIIGNLFVNNNYKTYVKSTLSNDEFLTLIGALGSISNGLSRFPCNLIFKKIGIKPMTTILAIINIVLYCTMKLTMNNQGVYCFMVIMCNMMLGTTLAMAPTQALKTFGAKVGADIYGFYWTCFALANFTAYGLATSIDLIILFYVFAGTSGLSGILVWLINYDVDWNQTVSPQPIVDVHSGVFIADVNT